MKFTLIKKYFGQSNQRFLSMTLHREGFLCLLLLVLFWGNGQSSCASSLDYQSNSILRDQLILTAQASLPQSVESAIRQDLSRRTNLKQAQFVLKQSSRQTWPDGCLGLGNDDELCTQALVNGWRVVMGYQDKTWVYRSDDTGMTIRLEK